MNANKIIASFSAAVFLLLPRSAYSTTYWGGTLPDVSGSAMESSVVESNGVYSYSYTMTSGPANTGRIWWFELDIKQPPGGIPLSNAGLSDYPGCFVQADEASSPEEIRQLNIPAMVPATAQCPPSWSAGLAVWGSLVWGPYGNASYILPGQTLGGFQIQSPGLPGIRDFKVSPKLIPPNEESDITVEQIEQVEDLSSFKGKTIGPTAPPMDSVGNPVLFTDLIKRYVAESQTMGWLADPALATVLVAELDAAAPEIGNGNAPAAQARLSAFMNMVGQATPAQIKPEARGLLFYNAKYLISILPVTVPPPVALLGLAPPASTAPLGGSPALAATFTVDGVPQAGSTVHLEITDGPNAGWLVGAPGQPLLPAPAPGGAPPPKFGCRSDANGQCRFSYSSALEGTDTLVAKMRVAGEVGRFAMSPPVKVTWSGGADMVIKFFIPPFIKTNGGGSPFLFTDITANDGNASAGPTVTRYYLSATPVFDPATAVVVGERAVPALAPRVGNGPAGNTFILPAGLAAGAYYLFACADADGAVSELDEANNCQVNQAVSALEYAPNRPPDCAGGTARLKSPPGDDDEKDDDERPVPADVLIENVTDPDGDAVSIEITAIREIEEEEPPGANGAGKRHGKKDEDEKGERYLVSFTARDGGGMECSGTAILTVLEEDKVKHKEKGKRR